MTDTRFRDLLKTFAQSGGSELLLVPGDLPRAHIGGVLTALDLHVLEPAQVARWTHDLQTARENSPRRGATSTGSESSTKTDVRISLDGRRYKATAAGGHISVRTINDTARTTSGAADDSAPEVTSAPSTALEALAYFGPVIANTSHAQNLLHLLERAESLCAATSRRVAATGTPADISTADQVHARVQALRAKTTRMLNHTNTSRSSDSPTGAASTPSNYEAIAHLDFDTPTL